MTKKINDSDLNSFDAHRGMLVRWSLHAQDRFAIRVAKWNIYYGDVELAIKKQEIKLKEDKNKFKTIFKVGDVVLTAIKVEDKDSLCVLTLWEANEEEMNIWLKK